MQQTTFKTCITGLGHSFREKRTGSVHTMYSIKTIYQVKIMHLSVRKKSLKKDS